MLITFCKKFHNQLNFYDCLFDTHERRFSTTPIGFAGVTHGIHALGITTTESTGTPDIDCISRKHADWYF